MKPPLHARALLGLGFLLAFTAAASARNDTIKIGILHSLSGTMAISESVLKDTVLMLVEDQNRKGGSCFIRCSMRGKRARAMCFTREPHPISKPFPRSGI